MKSAPPNLRHSIAPNIAFDRMRFTELRAIHPEAYELFVKSGKGGFINYDTVQFCGLMATSDGVISFLPRNSVARTGSACTKVAGLTMQALAKFSREHEKNIGLGRHDEQSAQVLSAIKFLADDFIKFGLFFERASIKNSTHGKVDWSATLTQKLPFHSQNHDVYFPNMVFRTSHKNTDHLLSILHAAVMREIIALHGWWLGNLERHKPSVTGIQLPKLPRDHWVKAIYQEMSLLFTQRSLDLARHLIAYLENTGNSGEGRSLFGLENFHTVWEVMLRKVLSDVDMNLLNDFPRPVYRLAGRTGGEKKEKGMQPDILIRKKNKRIVVDAKYYDAHDGNSAPGWQDIAKQLIYEQALAAISPSIDTENWFLFPSAVSGKGKISSLEMVDDSWGPMTCFRKIDCGYLSVPEVMEAYLSGSKIDIDRAMQTTY